MSNNTAEERAAKREYWRRLGLHNAARSDERQEESEILAGGVDTARKAEAVLSYWHRIGIRHLTIDDAITHIKRREQI